MEYLWRSIDEVIDKEGRVSEERVGQIAADIAAGLNATHSAGIIHRDIKPHNILMTTEGVAQLIDFGIAHARDQTALTRTGARLGTPHYISPEQVDGGTADERSDIYSLGCVMYHMLTGAPPFKAESAMAVMRMHLDAEPASLEARAGGIAPGLSRIVERCMAKRPSDRYMTAAELYQALKGNAAGKFEIGGLQRYEIGEEDGTPEEQLSAREMARAMLQPEIETTPESDKVCRNCGLGAQSNRIYCVRCGFSEWTVSGTSVFADPFTYTDAKAIGRKDPVREQAVFTRVALLSLLAIFLSLGMASILVWGETGDSALAGDKDLAEASANLDLPIVKRLETVRGNGETRVDLDRVEASVLGFDVISFRADFGGVETAITMDPIAIDDPGADDDPPPEPYFKRFSVDVFAVPNIGAERYIFQFQLPNTWLAEHEMDPMKIRLWTKSQEWAPLETFHIADEDGISNFLGFSPKAGEFATGALP